MIIKFFNWYGGKQRVVNLLLSLIPDGIEYWYEVCMGSAVLTLNSVRHKVEIINDLDEELVHLFKIMGDKHKGKILMDRLFKLKYSNDVFNKAKTAKYDELNDFEKAENTFVLITQSFNSTRKNYRKGVSQTNYTHSLMCKLPDVYRRLQGVQVESKKAIEVIAETMNNDKAFIFLDPPYRHCLRSKSATNEYGYEMSEDEHKEMLLASRNSMARIIISGYREDNGNDLYDNYLLPYGWKHYKLAELTKSCQTKKVKDVGEEWIWLNYEPPELSKYFINHSSINW